MSKRGIKGTNMTTQQKERFIERLEKFSQAASALLEAWEDGSEFGEAYPFGESFDETEMKISEWWLESGKALRQQKAVAEQTPAVVVLETIEMGDDFASDMQERGITYKVLGTIWNGWSVEYRGSRLALEKLVAEWWGDEDGSMGEQEKIQNAEGAQQ